MPADAKISAPGHAERTVACRVTAVEQATYDIRILHLTPERGQAFDYAAGQYARVAFADQPERDYSIASRPCDTGLEFHIRNMQGGPSLYASTLVEVGDRVTVRGPFGNTFLRPTHDGPILAIAGGSGLAPMKAIVEEALDIGVDQPIHLYFGARDERDVYLERHFRDLERRHPNLRYVPVLSEASRPTQRRTGLVTDAIAADFTELRDATAYLAGPPPMVEAAAALLRRLGVAESDIHADAFISEDERRRQEGEEGEEGQA